MHASNPETIYSAGSEDRTQARLITVSGSARTVPMSHRDKPRSYGTIGYVIYSNVFFRMVAIAFQPTTRSTLSDRFGFTHS